MTTLAITIKDEHQKFIEQAVKSGRYVSENEVVADALAELKAREQLREARIAELRMELQPGLDQLDRGEGIAWNVDAIKSKGRQLVTARATSA